ncbi:DUF5666 domain-containing protein [Hydrogenophaga sp. MI9]|uniref:DUF5666 domain-containing protein n=1 Tax=Hydrogenophaga sp. MI9 TaxID=3453719 RepID=UPI003EEC39B1
MREVSTPAATVSRRHWIALAVAALTGCGGSSNTSGDGAATGGAASGGSGSTASAGPTGNDGSTQTAGTPGTGGTGISVLGAISGFGSVIINGVHYDESGARITIDGAGASSGALRLGMVAGISGTRSPDGLTGVAQAIDIWSIAQGTVTGASGDSFTVMGMNIALKASTFADVAPSVGQTVVVWGLQADADGRQWVATRVDAASGHRATVTGRVEGSGENRSVNGIRLTGDKASGLGSGLYRLTGEWDAEKQQLEVGAVRRIDVRGDTGSGKVVEIEGVVTSALSGAYFMLGSVQVDASAVAGAAAALQVGQEIEVYGSWQGSVLVATKIENEDHD